MEKTAAPPRGIPAFVSVLAKFDLNSLIVLVFPQILHEICQLGQQLMGWWATGKMSQPWGWI